MQKREPGLVMGNPSERRVPINEEIIAAQVMLIGADGERLGTMDLNKALAAAREQSIDLVQMATNDRYTVCKLMDYGKHLFENKKQKGTARRRQRRFQVKEIKFRPGIEQGDYEIKLRNLRRFLNESGRVKITVRFRGREMVHRDLGLNLLERIRTDLEGCCKVEQEPVSEGRQIVMMLAPEKNRQRSADTVKKENEQEAEST